MATEEVLPMSVTICGLPGAESVTATSALRTPAAVGVKVTVIVHVAPAGSAAGQLLVSAKSSGSAPVRAMLEIVCGVSPFVSVTVCVWLVVPRLSVGNWRPEGFKAIPCKTLISEMKASQLPP